MTFFAKSDRFKEKVAEDQILGPGEYIAHKEYHIPHGVAPFGSTVDRSHVIKKEEAPPGDKEAKFFDEINTEFKSQITEVKPTAAFISKTSRFQQPVKAEEEKPAVPGPGNYQIPSFTEELNKKLVYKQHITAVKVEKKKQTETIKAMHNKRMGVPSIPGREQKLGYTFTDGQLRLNTRDVGFDGTKASSAGPGHYNLPTAINPQRMKGVQWRFTGKKVGSRVPSDSASVGPWSYNPNKDIKPLYKYKQSAAFASETPRKFLERENMSLASKKTKWSLADDDDDEEYIEDATPGPGYYYSPDSISSFKRSSKEHQYQLFNVGSERFPVKRETYQNIGPGKYHKDGTFVPKTFNKVLEHGGKRIVKDSHGKPTGALERPQVKNETKIKETVPGPGYYEVKNTLQHEIDKKVEKASFMPFMSSSFRFQGDAPQADIPGPGTYFNKDDEAEIIMEVTKENKVSHFFKSATKRENFVSRVETPIVGKYNLNQYDVAKAAERFALENAELRDPKVGFNSRADRFPEKIVEQDEPDQTVGNEVNKIFEQLPTFKAKAQKDKPKDKLVHPRVKNVILGTKEPRFKPLTKEDHPGPAAYHNKRYPHWDKPSFNSYYNKGEDVY